ncbi:MAG: hypothetical protein VX447_10195 [Pseudomonadota bacterium]|uniref:hypothetical protein n=1 Tax=Gallaecimonas pentaromativorans TaxID=584787 RepID=UPI00067EDA22|nr:hypothetical protein [Gallaecimonas pentaromativorans]MED5525108.1 hypothetical protein [Pseudomonadota bacterium]
MKNRVLLSITVGTLFSLGSAAAQAQQAPEAPQKAVKKETSHGGKCASGKCGTEKIYGKAALKHDPQGKLVRARDGKCGMTGKGVDDEPQKAGDSKCVSGVCGQ